MKITKRWIKKWKPCKEAVDWVEEQNTRDAFKLIHELRKSEIEDKYNWLFWAIPRLMETKKDKVRFAVYCAELVLHVFEKQYPNDKRPRKAIEAAKAWLEKPTEKNKANAADAADAAYAAYDAAAYAAYDVAAYAAYAAAADAADAAYAAAYAAYAHAAYAAAYAAYDAAVRAATRNKTEIKDKIVDYGVKLLKESQNE